MIGEPLFGRGRLGPLVVLADTGPREMRREHEPDDLGHAAPGEFRDAVLDEGRGMALAERDGEPVRCPVVEGACDGRPLRFGAFGQR